MRSAILGLVLAFSLARTASATTIDFEAQGDSLQVFYTNADPPLAIDVATFTGGQVLNHTQFGQTFVYGTANFCPGCTNPLDIDFSAPVDNLSVFVLNNMVDFNGPVAVNYTLADNSAHSVTFNITGGGGSTLLLPFSGILSATVTGAPNLAGEWNFFIDNVTFDTRVTAAPEPTSLLLIGSGLLAMRRKRSAPRLDAVPTSSLSTR